MNDAVERDGGESRNRSGIASRNHSKRSQPLWNLIEGSGVKRRQPRVARGERHKKINDFRTSNFAKHNSIRAHAQ
jgi:hypothetical protein